MKKFNKDRLDSLADVFAAWAGGYPEDRKETEAFLEKSGLQELIAVTDAERVFYHNAYFAEETLLAVYALMPVKLKLDSHEKAIFPAMLNRLNHHTKQLADSQLLNISFGKADEVFCRFYPDKHKFLEANKQELIRFNSKQKKVPKPRKLPVIISEAHKILSTIANRIASKKYRETHPEIVKARRKKYWETHKEEIKAKNAKYRQEHREELRAKAQKRREAAKERKRKIEEEKRRAEELKKAALKEASRLRNIVYREKNREAIRLRANERRLQLKEKNPELIKEYDKKANQRQSRVEAGKRYYERHKEIITQKAQDNPKVKEYKKRYKAKQRFKNTTGKVIIPLLQGIINFKSKE